MATKKQTKQQKADMKEYSSRSGGGSNTSGYGLKPEFGRVVEAKGGFDVIDNILSDDQVASTLEQRIKAGISTAYDVRTESEELKASTHETLSHIKFDEICGQMLLSAFSYGYAVAEILWKADGKIEIDAIKVRAAKRFTFDKEGVLRLKTQSNPQGEPMPPNKFWVFQYNPKTADDVFGQSLVAKCYWPTKFKTDGIKAWLHFLESASKPSMLGKYPAEQNTDSQIDALLDMLDRLQSSGVGAVPQGADIEFLKSHFSGTVDYVTLTQIMNSAISKIIVGQTMTTDEGGSLSQSKTHMQVRQDIVKADIDSLMGSFNGSVVTWLNNWNGADLSVWRKLNNKQEEDDDEGKAVDYVHKMSQAGFEPTEEWLEQRLGSGWQKKAIASLPMQAQQPQTNFAEPNNNDDVITNMAQQLADVVDAPMTDLIGQIKEVIDKANSLEEVAPLLLDLYSELNIDNIGNVIGGAFLNAEVQGINDRQEMNKKS